jgi:hypothetical protein
MADSDSITLPGLQLSAGVIDGPDGELWVDLVIEHGLTVTRLKLQRHAAEWGVTAFPTIIGQALSLMPKKLIIPSVTDISKLSEGK